MLDWLFVTPTELQAYADSGLTAEEVGQMYGVSAEAVMKMKPTFVAPPARAVGVPVSVLDLTSSMCAIVVDGDFDLPHYCGAPSIHPLRLCETHVKGFFAKETSI